MSIDIQQILLLFSGFNGTLIYNLLLILPIIAALLSTLRVRRRADRSYYRRLLLGLNLLLIFQLLHIIIELLFDFYLFPPEWIPAVEWALFLLSMVVITWLWAVPLPNRRLDDIMVGVGVIFVALVGLSSLWWLSQPGNKIYLLDWPEFLFSASALIMLTLGVILVLVRQVHMWGFGLVMLLLLNFGTLCFLLGIPEGGEIPLQIRLAQILAYPLLLLLPQRLLLHMGMGASEEEDIEKLKQLQHIERQKAILDSRPSFTDPKVLQSIFDMVEDTDPESVSRKITATSARIMQGDISLLALQSGIKGEFHVQSGYDLKNEKIIESFLLPVERMPVVKASLFSGETLILEPDRTSPDLVELSRCLNLSRTGPVLVTPILSNENNPDAGIILLSPYSNRKWTQGDQYYLAVLAKLLVHFLQHSREITRLRDQLAQTQRLEQVPQEIATASEPARAREPTSRYARLISEADTQPLTSRYGVNQRSGKLQQDLDQSWVPIIQAAELERLKGELTLALTEIASLRATLNENNQNTSN